MKKRIKELRPEDVLSVYSGKDGHCCCGCAGKHYHNPDYRELASKKCGYEVDDEACSARMVRKVVKLLTADGADVEFNDSYVATVVGARLYIAYLMDGVSVVEKEVAR